MKRSSRLERRPALRETGGARSAMNGANTQIPMSTEQKAGRMLTRAEKQSGSARGREPSAIRAAWCRRPRRLFSVVPRAHSRSPSRWAVSWAARSRLSRAFRSGRFGRARTGYASCRTRQVRLHCPSGRWRARRSPRAPLREAPRPVVNPIEGAGRRPVSEDLVSRPLTIDLEQTAPLPGRQHLGEDVVERHRIDRA